MTKKSEIPIYWEEGSEEPQTLEIEDEMPPVIYEDKERDLLNGEGTNREDVVMQTNNEKFAELDAELDRLKKRKEEKELEKQKKEEIKEKKSEIRHLKYEPAYAAGERIAAGMGALGGKITEYIKEKQQERNTPEAKALRAEKKAYRRAKMKVKMQRLAETAKEKAVSFGKSMHEKKPGGGFTSGGGFTKSFDGGSGGKSNVNIFGELRTPGIMKANLLTGSRQEETKISQKNPKKNIFSGTGSKLMTPNILTGKTKFGNGFFNRNPNNIQKKPGSKLMNERIKLY